MKEKVIVVGWIKIKHHTRRVLDGGVMSYDNGKSRKDTDGYRV